MHAEEWSVTMRARFMTLVQEASCGSGRRGFHHRGGCGATFPAVDPVSGPLLEVPPMFESPVFPSPTPSSGFAGSASGASPAGLENASGCNHCFLNVVIQAFFNLRSFRCRVLRAPDHLHGLPDGSPSADSGEADVESCCFCALQALFEQMQDAEGGGGSLPPDDLRMALSRVYDARGRFQLGEMEDATETIEALLGVFHACNVQTSQERERLRCGSIGDCTTGSSSCCSTTEECLRESLSPFGEFTSGGSSSSTAKAPSEPRPLRRSSPGSQHGSRPLLEAERVEEASNFGCHPLCIAHEVFGVECVDLTRCTFCGATSEPVATSSFVYRAYVADLLAAAEAAELSRAASPRPQERSPNSSVDSLVPGAATTMRSPTAAGRTCSLQDLLRGLCQREVPQKCRECNSLHTVFAERWLTQQPLTFVVSFVWPCLTPSPQTVWRVLLMIRPELRLDEVFRVARPGSSGTHARLERSSPVEADALTEAARLEAHPFRGLVCYSGMHYVALFWCWSRKKWLFFDDTCVREEHDWTSVATFIMNERYVPTLAFFGDVDKGESMPPECDVREFKRLMGELEDRRSTCTAM